MKYCDDCCNFKPSLSERGCELKHQIKFKVPKDIGQAHSGDWGWYRLKCADRVSIPPPPVVGVVRCKGCGHKASHVFHQEGPCTHRFRPEFVDVKELRRA